MLKQFDKDDDGKLSADEIMKGMDANGDGKVSIAEFVDCVVRLLTGLGWYE